MEKNAKSGHFSEVNALMNRIFYFLFGMTLFFGLMVFSSALANPSVIYCKELGYNYVDTENENGSIGYCIISESVKLNAWDFFNGKVGEEYSYCAKQGYDQKIISVNGTDEVVCIVKRNFFSRLLGIGSDKEVSEDELMNLSSKLEGIMRHIYSSGNSEDAKINLMNSLGDRYKLSVIYNQTNFSYWDWRFPPNGTVYNASNSFYFDSINGWMTSVKNQGSCGSCWSYSIVGSAEAKYNIMRNDSRLDPDLSEQNSISCDNGCYVAWPTTCQQGCSGGYLDLGLKYIMNSGTVDESCFPTSLGASCSSRCSDYSDRLWNITNYTTTWPDGGSQAVLSINETKQWLLDYGPLTSVMYMESSSDPGNNIYRCSDESHDPNHAVVLVGYNDTGTVSTSYWIIKNSWGTGYGISGSGYFKLGFDECQSTAEFEFAGDVNAPSNFKPTINLNYPENNSNVSLGNVSFNFTVYNKVYSTSTCDLLVNNVTVNSSSSVSNGTQTVLYYNLTSQTSYNWSVNCFENSLGVIDSSDVRVVNYRNSPPSVILISPANNSFSSAVRMNMTFRCNSTDDLALKNVTLTVWNSTGIYNQTSMDISGVSNMSEFNITNITSDYYTWNCRFTDNQNNFSSSSTNYSFSFKKQFILVVVDGLQLNHFNRMLTANFLGNYSRLITGAGWNVSLNITGHSTTETAPGNAELLTGLNSTFNNVSSNSPVTIIPVGNTTFDRLKTFDSSILTGFVYGKTTPYIPNGILANSLSNIDWAQNKTTYNNSVWTNASNTNYAYSENVSTKAIEFLTAYANKSFFLVVYFGVPDGSGHRYGENSSEYEYAINNTDYGLSVLLNSLENLGLRGENNITQIIVSADHGWNTNTTGHSTENSDTLVIPLLSNNKSLIVNMTSDGIREQCEVAPTILDYMGIPTSSFQDIINNGCDSMIGDAIPPRISVNKPDSSYSSLPISFEVVLDETGSCSYSINGGITNYSLSSLDNLTFSSSSSSIAEGSYTSNYYCYDSSGNFNSIIKSFSYSIPVVNTGSPGGGNDNLGGGGAPPSTTNSNNLINSFSEEQISLGIDQMIAPLQSVGFKFSNENHTIKVMNITNTSANILVSSTPQLISLAIGQNKSIDLNQDNVFDINIKLNNILNGKADIFVKKIVQNVSSLTDNSTNYGNQNNQSVSPMDNFFKNIKTTYFAWFILTGIILVMSIILFIIFRKKETED